MVLSLLIALFAGPLAHAGVDSTRESLDRLEEVLELRIEDGQLSLDELLPAILVRAEPLYVLSEGWFGTGAIEALEQAFGPNSLRLCEACMAPRAYVNTGRMTYQTGPISLQEVALLDEQTRGSSAPARSAIWINEHSGGVSARIVDLHTGRVIFAQNIDANLIENANSERMYTLSAELERRARGESITQSFVDFAVYPQQHISLDWTDQWGQANENLSGFTLSIVDPVIGVGACHYRRLKIFNLLVGGKAVVSLPTALSRSFSQSDFQVFNPLLTAVGVVRVPIGRSNYGGVLTVSTNGKIGIGISLMNVRFLPVFL